MSTWQCSNPRKTAELRESITYCFMKFMIFVLIFQVIPLERIPKLK